MTEQDAPSAPPAVVGPVSGREPDAATTTPRPLDVRKLELDDLLREVIDRAEDVVATQGRLRGLLRANQSVVGNLTLPVLLLRTVQAACELAKARYGALGIIDPAGGLEQFVHVGMDDDVVTRIGHLPEGKGLLGALIDDPRPIRLQTMVDDVRSVGFPTGHPPMSSFLGVPVRVRNEVFGNLYLCECENGAFSAEDEELVSALAATAGVAIENARLYDEARRRQLWLEASTEVTQQLLADDGEDPLLPIARHARRIADADVVTVVLPTPDGHRLVVEIAAGHRAAELTAVTVPIEGSLVGLAFTTGRPILVPDVEQDPSYPVGLSDLVGAGPVMVLPLGAAPRVRGALVIGRLSGRHRFTDADLEMATTFANHAAIALELADARADQQRIVLLEDHDRIARDLHDHVTQRLFAIGLTVQSVAAGLGPDAGAADTGLLTARLTRVVAEIDETIRQTRTSIFALRGPLGPETGTVRTRLLAVVADIAPLLDFTPAVRFGGPIDAVVPEPHVDDLVAVLREALTNVARHAQAHRVDVEVSATLDWLSLTVIDDGVGIGVTQRRSGLANLRQRASLLGGSFTLSQVVQPDTTAPDQAPGTREGTRLLWTIPLT